MSENANDRRSPARILVVEDDDSIRKLAITALRRQRFDAEGVTDGEEALSRIKSERYALILLDLMMPRMTGWQLLDALHALPPEQVPPVVVMTAVAETTKLDPRLVKSVVRKPFDIDLLCDVVAGCAGRPEDAAAVSD